MQAHAVNVIVILTVEGEDRMRTVGVIVDDVSDVYALREDQIKPSPDFGAAISTEFIKGIATLDSNIVIVLDTNKLFSLEELSKMDALEQGSTEQHDPQEQ